MLPFALRPAELISVEIGSFARHGPRRRRKIPHKNAQGRIPATIGQLGIALTERFARLCQALSMGDADEIAGIERDLLTIAGSEPMYAIVYGKFKARYNTAWTARRIACEVLHQIRPELAETTPEDYIRTEKRRQEACRKLQNASQREAINALRRIPRYRAFFTAHDRLNKAVSRRTSRAAVIEATAAFLHSIATVWEHRLREGGPSLSRSLSRTVPEPRKYQGWCVHRSRCIHFL